MVLFRRLRRRRFLPAKKILGEQPPGAGKTLATTGLLTRRLGDNRSGAMQPTPCHRKLLRKMSTVRREHRLLLLNSLHPGGCRTHQAPSLQALEDVCLRCVQADARAVAASTCYEKVHDAAGDYLRDGGRLGALLPAFRFASHRKLCHKFEQNRDRRGGTDVHLTTSRHGGHGEAPTIHGQNLYFEGGTDHYVHHTSGRQPCRDPPCNEDRHQPCHQ